MEVVPSCISTGLQPKIELSFVHIPERTLAELVSDKSPSLVKVVLEDAHSFLEDCLWDGGISHNPTPNLLSSSLLALFASG